MDISQCYLSRRARAGIGTTIESTNPQVQGGVSRALDHSLGVPSYITALVWHGMFNPTDGFINACLVASGLDGVAWFDQFWTAFSANVVTNTWLGFPFMMVVSLGALQSIPTDLYEAAEVDGATRWDCFKSITIPLLRPALLPAIILGAVWTFNMFNVIYLVSGGGQVTKPIFSLRKHIDGHSKRIATAMLLLIQC